MTEYKSEIPAGQSQNWSAWGPGDVSCGINDHIQSSTTDKGTSPGCLWPMKSGETFSIFRWTRCVIYHSGEGDPFPHGPLGVGNSSTPVKLPSSPLHTQKLHSLSFYPNKKGTEPTDITYQFPLEMKTHGFIRDTFWSSSLQPLKLVWRLSDFPHQLSLCYIRLNQLNV